MYISDPVMLTIAATARTSQPYANLDIIVLITGYFLRAPYIPSDSFLILAWPGKCWPYTRVPNPLFLGIDISHLTFIWDNPRNKYIAPPKKSTDLFIYLFIFYTIVIIFWIPYGVMRTLLEEQEPSIALTSSYNNIIDSLANRTPSHVFIHFAPMSILWTDNWHIHFACCLHWESSL